MNTKSNQRFQETDKKIRQVFLQLLSEKDLSHTTVQDICKGCNINRSTFYAHYIDIYDLLSQMESSIRMEMYGSFQGTTASPEHFLSPEYFEIILSHMKKHCTFYRAYLESFGKPTIEDGLLKIKEYILRPYFIKLGIHSEARLTYHFTFFCFGFIAVVKQWLNNGCQESPQELSQILWDSLAPIPMNDNSPIKTGYAITCTPTTQVITKSCTAGNCTGMNDAAGA